MAQFVNPCGPPPERCPTPPFPTFSTGVSVRRVALCGPPYCDCDAPSIGRYRVRAGGTLDRSNWLEGWIFSQLVTRGEISCDEIVQNKMNEHPLKAREGGWWADAFRRTGEPFKSGSKLWSLQWSFVNNDALVLAKAYAVEALSCLVRWGVVSRINVEASYVSRQVMRLAVKVTGPGNVTAVTVNGQALPTGGWIWSEP